METQLPATVIVFSRSAYQPMLATRDVSTQQAAGIIPQARRVLNRPLCLINRRPIGKLFSLNLTEEALLSTKLGPPRPPLALQHRF